jgi:hypothetical protein
MSAERDIWEDRPVTFGEFSIKDGKAVRASFVRDSEEGTHMLVVASMRWADSNELVFKSLDELEALPFRHRDRLARLANKAARANGMNVRDPDAPELTNGAAVNAEVTTGPSH